MSKNFGVVKKGFVNVHYYYIPVTRVEGWDSNVLWLKIGEKEVKEKYERDAILDPSNYYVKDYPYYNTYFRSLSLIPSKRESYYHSNTTKKISKINHNLLLINK